MPVLLSSIGVYMRWQLLADSPSREFYARTEVSVLLSTRPTALSSARNLAGWGTFCLEGSSSDGKGRGGPRLRWTDERGGKTWAYPANAGLLHVGSYVRSSGDSASPIDAVSELGTYSTFRVPTPTMIPLVVPPPLGYGTHRQPAGLARRYERMAETASTATGPTTRPASASTIQ